ncbi:MAG: TolC family protein [Gammaproteobacteria bacterium]|nr:TolC family protein [Gammaproteobacteria bacterium]
MKLITYPIVAVLILLTGCTSIPDDLGRSEVNILLSKRGIPVNESTTVTKQELLDSLTSKPLTSESAVRIALVNNPHMHATYAELGIAAADVYEAGRMRNPVFHFSSLDTNESGERNLTTFGLIASFTDLITLSSRKRYAAGEFSAMKQSVGAEVLAMAAEVESAFYHFVAAKQVAALRAQIAKSGAISLELAQRYYDAGNLSSREYAMEHASASELQLVSLEAEADAYEKRTELATLLGLSVVDDWDSPAQLPVPLKNEDDIDELLELAKDCRLDLAAANTRAELLANKLGVTNWTRFLGDLNVGIEHERESDGAELTGPALEWEISIFTQNRDQYLRVNAELKKAIAEVQYLTVAIENDVHLAHTATQNSKARLNEYRKKLIPARIESVERAQEEENFMLIGTFELLETKREEYDTYQGYLEVVRDYWLARTELANAIGTTLPSNVHIGDEQLDVKEYIAPKDSIMDHSGHNTQPEVDHSSHEMQPETDHSGHDMQQSNEHSEMQHQDNEMDHSSHDMQPETNHSEHDTHSSH